MRYTDDVLIVVRSKRPAIQTLETYTVPFGMNCIVLSDPSVYRIHKKTYAKHQQITVVKGVEGLAAQAHRIYRLGADEGYDWVFRLDDDLHSKYFVAADPEGKTRFPTLSEAIRLAYKAANGLNVKLVGFSSSSRVDWLGQNLALTYGGLHGSAQLHCTTKKPSLYIDPSLPRFEDVWRTCSHRHHDGAVGRVQVIGVQKAKSSNALVNQSVVDDRPKRRQKAIQMVNDTWHDYVSCTSTTHIHGGKLEIPHFAFTRFGFKPRHISP